MRRWLADQRKQRPMLLSLSLLLLLAACTSPDKSDNDNRRNGFYGGISGGVTRLR